MTIIRESKTECSLTKIHEKIPKQKIVKFELEHIFHHENSHPKTSKIVKIAKFRKNRENE